MTAGGGPELARYVQLLEASKEMDLKAIEVKKIIYRAGKDSTGLPVFVVCVRHLVLTEVDLNELLMHMVRTPISAYHRHDMIFRDGTDRLVVFSDQADGRGCGRRDGLHDGLLLHERHG